MRHHGKICHIGRFCVRFYIYRYTSARKYMWILALWMRSLFGSDLKCINQTVSLWKRSIIWWVLGSLQGGSQSERDRKQSVLRVTVSEGWDGFVSSEDIDMQAHIYRQIDECTHTRAHTLAHSTKRDPWCSWPWISRLGWNNMRKGGRWGWQSEGFGMKVHSGTWGLCVLVKYSRYIELMDR